MSGAPLPFPERATLGKTRRGEERRTELRDFAQPSHAVLPCRRWSEAARLRRQVGAVLSGSCWLSGTRHSDCMVC